MKKIIIIGANGYLGTAITDLASRNYPVVATYRKEPCPVNAAKTNHVYVDFENQQSVADILRLINPTDIVIVALNVEYASPNETIFNNYHWLLYTLKRDGIKTVFISSDAVFVGEEESFDEEDAPNPITDYGKYIIEGFIFDISCKIARRPWRDLDDE